MNIDLTPIIQAFIALIATIITVFVIPKITKLLQEKLTSEQRKQLSELVAIAVSAAEQLFGSKAGTQKKEYVVSFLLSKGIVFDVDEVNAMIESEVFKMSEALKQQNETNNE